jgi:hypothetical protein
MTIPEPSKRPFGSPVDETVLPFFCHPWLPVFRAPVRHPEDGCIYAASGFVAVRFRTGRWFPEEFPPAPEEFTARIAELPWGGFVHDPARCIVAPTWRDMDDSRGTIYAGGSHGLLPLWCPKTRRLIRETIVRTCNGPLVPLALLQLLARLPKCQVKMTAGNAPLHFRFNGGEGIVAKLFRDTFEPRPAFELFKARDHSGDLHRFTF